MDDFRTPFDPFNKFVIKGKPLDANPNNIERVTKPIFKFYMPWSECETCLVQWEAVPKHCLATCKLTARFHDYKTKDTLFVETKMSQDWPLCIYLSRYALVWNYYEQIPFILRFGVLNDLVVHHLNFVEIDDRRFNLVARGRKEHSGMHARVTDLRSQIREIYTKVRDEPRRENELRWRIEEIYKLTDNRRNTSKLQVIVEGVKDSLSKGKVYIAEQR